MGRRGLGPGHGRGPRRGGGRLHAAEGAPGDEEGEGEAADEGRWG